MFVVSVRERGKEEHKFTFRKTQIVIGRLRANDIILPKRNISKRHARLELTDDGRVMLLDNGSTNGSYLNGKKVLEPTVVGPDDKMFMGDYIIQIELAEDKSAIEEAGIATDHTVDSSLDPVSHEKETVADIPADMLKEELAKMQSAAEEDESPETVVLDPTLVPTEPPPDLEVLTPATEESPTEDPLLQDEEEEAGDTMRLREAGQLEEMVPEEPIEELIDIPLMEEEEEEPVQEEILEIPIEIESEPTPAPAPLPEPEPVVQPPAPPEPEPVVQPPAPPEPEPPIAAVKPPAKTVSAPAEAYAPSLSRLETGVSVRLNANYDRLARQFADWCAGPGKGAGRDAVLQAVKKLVQSALGDVAAQTDLDEVVGQVAAELGYLGAVAPLLADPKVGEVFVATSGQLTAYDWRGEVAQTGASLSCPAANRQVAAKILAAAGAPDDAGYAQARLADGSLGKVFASPFASNEPILRFVRPFQTTMSLAKLKDTGVAANEHVAVLNRAVAQGRSVLVVGPRTQPLSLVLHSLTSAIPPDARIAASGDRFAPGSKLDGVSLFDADALHDPEFSNAFAAMGFERMIVEDAGGELLFAIFEMAAAMQIPFLASARMLDKANLAASIGATDLEGQEVVEVLLRSTGAVIVSMGPQKIEGLYLYTLKDGKIQLAPFSN